MENHHHSLSDWEFLDRLTWNPYTRYDLYTELFVSPPSCLRFDPFGTPNEIYALSKLPLAQNLPAGRITTWARSQASGVGDPYIYIGVTGVGSRGIPFEIRKSTTTWTRVRLDWWQGVDGLNNPATLLSESYWDGEKWGPPAVHTHPPLSGNINRVGIGLRNQAFNADKYYDDTEIWLPI